MTHITTEVDEGPILRLAFNLGMEDPMLMSGEELHSSSSFGVFLNGGIAGVIVDSVKFISTFRKLRQLNYISGYVSIYPDLKQRAIYISSDSGRLCRCVMSEFYYFSYY